MGLSELKQLVEDLPGESALKREVHGAFQHIRRLKDEKTSLNESNQELLRQLSEERQRREDLNQRVQINRITGLPNHHRMASDMNELLSASRGEIDTHRGAIFFLRLDRSFQTMQSTMKPQMLEWILYQVSQRIQEIIGDNGTVYHSRENEFVIILTGNLSKREFSAFGSRLRAEVRRPHNLSGYNIHIDCHIGIAEFPQHGREKGRLLQNADIALQAAEERSVELVFFEEDLREQVVEKMELQNSILRALEQQAIVEIGKQFEIYYQPIINITEDPGESPMIRLEDGSGWRISDVGAEALIRWNHPNKGLIPPDRFIPLAEETGLIIPIGNWIIYNVSEQIRAWRDKGLELGPVSVNISPRQFHSETFVHSVRNAMANNRLSSESFRFEITETSIAQDPETMIKTMWELHDEGVYFYIDDFGTGYSSLSYVHQMPVKKIKIDKSFVFQLHEDKREQTIVRTIIAMAKELGLGLVAEGVEEKAHLSYLLQAGVRSFQGYYFSRPLQAARFASFLEAKSYLPDE
jgi:EAL domain-containing protein (putative c-di-GMP-specific phosphodiesterase class I)/GGDEF domain-containing protein